MDISVIIVSWKVKDKLKANLESVMASSGVSFECFVVDNNSDDGTLEMLEKDFPSVIRIANTENLGFAKACNQAMKQAQGKYILLLNPDMQVFPDTLAETFKWLEANPQAAIAGINLIGEDGQNIKHVRRFPKLLDQMAICLKFPHLFPQILDSYLRKDFDYNKSAQVDSIRGAFFLIRRSAFKILGLLDERYFLWFEEVDYCRRAKENNLEVWYTSSAKAKDFIGQSFNQISLSQKQSYFRQSMLAYFKKWHPYWQFCVIKISWFISSLIVIIARGFGFSSRTRT